MKSMEDCHKKMREILALWDDKPWKGKWINIYVMNDGVSIKGGYKFISEKEAVDAYLDCYQGALDIADKHPSKECRLTDRGMKTKYYWSHLSYVLQMPVKE